MYRLNLQTFAVEEAKPVEGKKLVYLYRAIGEASKEAGTVMAFTTENTKTKSKDADTTITKDGAIRTPSATEIEISATSLLAKGDKMLARLEKAMDDNEIIEIWEANLEDPGSGGGDKFNGTYYQGYLTEFEISSNAEDYVEISTTFAINGTGATGEVTVSAAQQAIADYAFKDTAKTGA